MASHQGRGVETGCRVLVGLQDQLCCLGKNDSGLSPGTVMAQVPFLVFLTV